MHTNTYDEILTNIPFPLSSSGYTCLVQNLNIPLDNTLLHRLTALTLMKNLLFYAISFKYKLNYHFKT